MQWEVKLAHDAGMPTNNIKKSWHEEFPNNLAWHVNMKAHSCQVPLNCFCKEAIILYLKKCTFSVWLVYLNMSHQLYDESNYYFQWYYAYTLILIFYLHHIELHLIVYFLFLHQDRNCCDNLKDVFIPCTRSIIYIPLLLYPSCVHTTWVLLEVQPSAQTVPQVLLMQISSCPSLGVLPLTSCSWPWEQPKHFE